MRKQRMPDVLIRNVPASVVDALKQRAERHERSFQQELIEILVQAGAQSTDRWTAAEGAAAIRARLAATRRVFGDSVDLIREDRER
jgi:plasmid stability protein